MPDRHSGRHRQRRVGEPIPPPPPAAEDEHPDHVGPRRAALETRRKEHRRKVFSVGGIATIVACLLAVVVVARVVDQATGPEDNEPSGTATSKDEGPVVTLIYGTKEAHPERGAIWMALMSYDEKNERGAFVYLPSHTAAEVPGHGLQPVGESLASGGVPLLLVSAENLVGVPIDRYIELSDRAARVLFTATGDVSVDVPEEVRVAVGKNQARLIFNSGQQRLSPPFLVQLLYTHGLDSDDVELGSRHIAFWTELFELFHEEPGKLGAAVERSEAALAESDVDPKEHAKTFTALAALDSADLMVTSLPVQQMSVEDSELYASDPDQIQEFLVSVIGTDAVPRDDVRVQILNGNGAPGIGQEVASRLIGQGFRVILPGNARHLDYPQTLIITYDSSDEGITLAEKARDLLGLGEVQVSQQQQGIVDLTIVVGEDWLRQN
jgi:LytR cell envelope-related transcriptional attenuator